jgi:hypothetical protein
MTLRIGFDMDGVLADFAGTFHEIERQLFGAGEARVPRSPEDESEESAESAGGIPAERTSGRELDRRQDTVWRRIRATKDFWTSLRPTDPNAVRRLHALMLQHRWEVVFITQRPSTAGETVQRQTQRWLVQQGFDMPSVLVIAGSRGAAAQAMRLTHHVDDSARNCVDVKSDSSAVPILVGCRPGDAASQQARKLGIGVATTIVECLTLLEGASSAPRTSGALQRLAALVSWNS